MAAIKVSKIHLELLKRVLEVRSVTSLYKRDYSESVPDNFFKFYSDEKVDFGDKYRVLDEKDYTRFLSKRSLRREPALTRLISQFNRFFTMFFFTEIWFFTQHKDLLCGEFWPKHDFFESQCFKLQANLAYKVGKQMISLAEGMPNEEMFPFSRLELTTKTGHKILIEDKELATALQYVPSQGLPALLSELRRFQQDAHRPPAVPRDVLVTNGAQHGIYQCMEMLVDPGDALLTTEYSYTGLHAALRPYHPEILGIPEDDEGMIVSNLESVLQDRLARGLKMPKVLYLIPTGNNPTGTVLPADRRRKIYELACQYDFLIIEDDPYMFLNYSDDRPPSFLSMDWCGRVVRLDSGSKVLSAGMRAGWLSAPTALLHRAELHSQAELLHPCTLSQAILYRLLSQRGSLRSHLQAARAFYAARREALRRALRGVRPLADWAEPQAGLFYWLRVRGVDDVYNMVLHTAFQRGLMLIPGQAFQYDTRAPCRHVRLAFSKVAVADMEPAARHLADIIRDEQKLARKLHKRVATEG